MQLEVVEEDGLARVGDDAAHDGGEEVRVARVLHVAVVLVEPVLEKKRGQTQFRFRDYYRVKILVG